MGIEYTPVWHMELNPIFCPNLEIGTSRHRRSNDTPSSRNVEQVFNLPMKGDVKKKFSPLPSRETKAW
jgi:hypothetical protein